MIKIALCGHVERIDREIEEKILEIKDELNFCKFNWLLEQDNMSPFFSDVLSFNRGSVIEEMSSFFRQRKFDKDSLGIHVHFVNERGHIDTTYENQRNLIEKACEIFKERFKHKPKIFAGGWWYSDGNTDIILSKLGFKYNLSHNNIKNYKEIRKNWFLGIIPTPIKVVVNEQKEIKNPRVKMIKNILKLSLDKCLEANWKSLLKTAMLLYEDEIIALPFHPHSLNSLKLEMIKETFKEIMKYKKVEFVALK